MYEKIAPIYDLIHKGFTADIDYILELAREYEGPVVDLGCGTGRLLLPLAESGCEVTGIDNSPEMLSLAQDKIDSHGEHLEISLVEVDILDVNNQELRNKFGLGIISHNSLLHFKPDQRPSLLQSIRSLLKPDGVLFIDVVNPIYLADSDPEDEFVSERAGYYTRVIHDVDNQYFGVTWYEDDSNADRSTESIAHVDYFYIFLHQALMELEDAGFDLLSVEGAYDHQPYSENAERMLLLARVRQ